MGYLKKKKKKKKKMDPFQCQYKIIAYRSIILKQT